MIQRELLTEDTPDGLLHRVAGTLDVVFVHEHRERLEGVALSGNGLLMDLTEVVHLDSTGLGLLVALRRMAAAEGGSLRVLGKSEAVEKLLQAMFLDDLF